MAKSTATVEQFMAALEHPRQAEIAAIRAAILAAWPDRASQVRTLRQDGGDITDPVGSSVEVYHECAEQLERELTAFVASLPADFLPVAVEPREGENHAARQIPVDSQESE